MLNFSYTLQMKLPSTQQNMGPMKALLLEKNELVVEMILGRGKLSSHELQALAVASYEKLYLALQACSLC